ncbi:hypothetical protein GR168_17940 [Gordonia sp. JH63]|uniref:Secreted protein n=1 Tax=Gordonia hongkongensis TaxID=1701090 RepID=A0AAX3T4H0_9ACTN|nr:MULTISPECIES: hypothetical protein [Gordonia]QIK46919.1 hypothetical protein G8C36_06490 [Gordonia terrae]KSU57311.1 hypothetical protein AS181_15025 [Gordonia sp. SGD-V-85]MBN0973676.1 hypothetical protein [Gordonia sp. BP-119]MBN0983558.1 hypothetical protein [Gordonia sp. BP-94]QHD87054.1 hypothetical protein GR168_17940 [Gordonia sp. JH63]
MASVLATVPAAADSVGVPSPGRNGTPLHVGRGRGVRGRRTAGLYFDQMEITEIRHRRLHENHWSAPEDSQPATRRRR